jgi:hypothetical protein
MLSRNRPFGRDGILACNSGLDISHQYTENRNDQDVVSDSSTNRRVAIEKYYSRLHLLLLANPSNPHHHWQVRGIRRMILNRSKYSCTHR